MKKIIILITIFTLAWSNQELDVDPEYKGNLNRDGIEDGIEMYENKNGDRELILFLGTKEGGFTKVATNSKIVLRADAGGARGDPFMGVVIKNEYFSVEHYGGGAHRWKTITTFKYSKTKKNWFLHKDSSGNYVDKEDLDEIKWKIKTVKDFGVVLFENYDRNKECKALSSGLNGFVGRFSFEEVE